MSEARRFNGQANKYTEVGARGNERIGLGVTYGVHPSGPGIMIVRFVAYSASGEYQPFTHFISRQQAGFKDAESGQAFYGIRLNKFGVPLFNPGPAALFVAGFIEKAGMWSVLAGWISEQLIAEGFTVTTDLEAVLKHDLGFETNISDDGVKMVLEFPDLAAYHTKAAEYAVQKKAAKLATKDDDDDDDDIVDDDEVVN